MCRPSAGGVRCSPLLVPGMVYCSSVTLIRLVGQLAASGRPAAHAAAVAAATVSAMSADRTRPPPPPLLPLPGQLPGTDFLPLSLPPPITSTLCN